MYINWKRKELIITLALCGPRHSGKSTTWRYWSRKASPPPEDGADMFSLRLENIQGKRLILHVRDISGSDTEAIRRVALYGVDGLIFVADSHPEQREANRRALHELEKNLASMNKPIETTPLLLQYNKRDLADALPLNDLDLDLNPGARWPYQETIAIKETGLAKTLRQATDLALAMLL
jgi:hypothetical protein